MPKYEYRCEQCGETAEYDVARDKKDTYRPRCRWCGGKMRPVFTPIPFVFKEKD